MTKSKQLGADKDDSTRMGLTKQYLRYVAAGKSFGIISSSNADCLFVQLSGTTGRFVATSACENIIIWDTKTGEKVRTLTHLSPHQDLSPSEVLRQDHSEAIVLTGNSNLIAAGYTSGVVRIFDIETGDLKATLTGHSTGISCLTFDQMGMRLASGANDTEIVVYDVVSESGMFRLKGHKHVVTQVQFLPSHSDVLVSSSRDSFLKFWDLKTQHCFKTVTGHKTEVWDFVLIPARNWIITGTSDSELRVWKYDMDSKEDDDDENVVRNEDDEAVGDGSVLTIRKVGSFLRQSTTPVRCLVTDSERYVAVCGRDSLVECYKLRNETEIRASMRKRAKKERRRVLKDNEANDEKTESNPDQIQVKQELVDEVEPMPPVRAGTKVKSLDVVCRNDKCIIAGLLTGNGLEVYSSETSPSDVSSNESPTKSVKHPTPSFQLQSSIMNDGHRTDIRAVAFSSDNYFLLTASADSVKVWSRQSHRCIVSINEGIEYSLCCLFAPGDKNCLIGTKNGNILIYDILSAKLLESVPASESHQAIWSMDLYPDRKGIVCGSEDKTIKFYDFDLVQDEGTSAKRLSIKHTRSLQLEEGVLCVKISPNNKFIAVSLLDSTVKIFFLDTLKFFLNLYGHKLPVLTLDISSDSTLIVTGSPDKNIKIWGMDFGDCHKSIFAHEEPVTCVKFVPNTHYVFSSGKDGLLKQWDADHFEKIMTLRGHLSEIWSFAISPSGKYLSSVSHDRTIRLWEKTNEPLILQEEQEEERDAEFEKRAFADESETIVPGEFNQETGMPHKKTLLTIRGTELLLEAIDVHRQECESLRTFHYLMQKHKEDEEQPLPKHDPHPLLQKFRTRCPDRFVLETLRSIKSSELDEALLSLPFNYVCDLLKILSSFLEKDWEYELVNRVVTFLTRIHFGQISSSADLLPLIDRLSVLCINRCKEYQELVGCNLAALRFLQDRMNERHQVSLFTEAYDKLKEKRNKKKKRENTTSATILRLQ